MEEAVILMRDALREMETGRVFSIRLYTGNLKDGTGGKRIDIERAVLNHVAMDTEESRGAEMSIRTASKLAQGDYSSIKAPNHSKNRTRNIMIMPSQEIRKIHIALFTRFNGKKVVY